jgi:cupin superfamily acireductone dioxygenase involved in methionine salvage
MKQININCPLFISNVTNHTQIKNDILQSISSMGSFSYRETINNITNTDWHLNNNYSRKYFEIVKPVLYNHIDLVKKTLGYKTLDIINYWFQQYYPGDYHGWHNHGKCVFSNVYYVDLAETSPKTQFKLGDTEFYVDVSEGDIITFPSFLAHQSPINQSSFVKTVIAFNVDGDYC